MVFEEILYIGILLVGAKLMGEVFRRIHQPVLIGHVIAGIVLGPALFAIIQPIDEIELFLSIGIFFLFFSMGIAHTHTSHTPHTHAYHTHIIHLPHKIR